MSGWTQNKHYDLKHSLQFFMVTKPSNLLASIERSKFSSLTTLELVILTCTGVNYHETHVHRCTG
ncbi:hypothetical protein vB_PsyM_KIL5_0120 [Pseudomonas phage vB_PsyM_KIL5]|uniref:Uncharacterized protein n=1 Tax=Pseudomonas phage vB_PsyM_KIL5 TaxID=1777070 RepID=A0A142IFK6_9CAUD|nr:hypothetical protein vB_PsyM_KIL5_0120 [Pseudomonas phage vB_PsyM_KIL5]